MISKVAEWLQPDLGLVKEYMHSAVKGQAENELLERLISESVSNPGKMVRPLTLFLAAGEKGEKQKERLTFTAAALELLHISSLILDDMIDDSKLRRGRITIQAEHGRDVALYVGDYLLVRSYSCLMERGCHKEAEILMKVGQTACDGEMHQRANLHDTGVGIDNYMKAIRGKTAFFFKAICRMACLIAERDDEERERLEEFGEKLGIMFQIRDDLSDWTQDEEKLGKPSGEDFSEGIYTLPAIYTFSKDGYGESLRKIAGKEKLSAEDINEAKRLVTEAGGIEYTEKYLAGLAEETDDIISSLPEDRYTKALKKLVRLCSYDAGGERP